MNSFCGENETFWDSKLTWDSDEPDFTTCFEKTVLVWVPCGFIWLLSWLDIYYSNRTRSRNIPWNALNITKATITIILMIIQLLDLGFGFYMSGIGENYHFNLVDRYTPVIKIITFGLSLFLLLYGRINGLRSSDIQFLFWVLLSFTEAFRFRTVIINSSNYNGIAEIFPYITFIIYYPMVVGMFLLNCWADANPEYGDGDTSQSQQKSEKPCPEEYSSALSRMIFFWFEGLAIKGYRRPLVNDDLWNLNKEDQSKNVVPIFDKYWLKDVEACKRSNAKQQQTSGLENGAIYKGDSIEFKKEKISTKKHKEPSIMPALIKSFGIAFLFGSIMKLINDLLIFVPPQILKLLIGHVTNKEESWKGYFFAALLLVTAMIQTLIISTYFKKMFLVGMHVRTSLVSAIYRKSLRISTAARKESTMGEIVNLMSVDAQRFMDLTTYLNMLWSAPLQIGLSLYFLYEHLGPSVFSGLAVMILLIPINACIANRVKTLQIKQMKMKDQRVKLMNEILSGIKVLKLYAWEPSFEEQVQKIRKKELDVIKTTAYLNAGTSFIWTCAPFLVSVVTFATYILIDPTNNILDASKAFVSLALFNIMRMPMSMLPMMIVAVVQVALSTFATYVLTSQESLNAQKAFVSLSLFNILRFPIHILPMIISNLINASVSVKRVNKFMNAEEVDSDAVTKDTTEDDPVVIENGNFKWDEDTSALKNINLRVKNGDLVAVVGVVGSGKTTLLSSILGELEKTSGRVNVNGSLAYVAQQSWIQNSTLRDNILFGKAFDPDRYDRIIAACALKPDLEILPAGDKTEIGEKGINLSGGQKARVALARATYNDADIYLLDDPLSAVDSHVGKHIFEQVLGNTGILRKKTRVLVTHGIIYLPKVDHIVVMKDGEISESGTYKELLTKKGDFADFIEEHLDTIDDENEEIIQDLESIIGSREEIFARQKSRMSETTEDGNKSFQRNISIVSQGSDKSVNQRKLSQSQVKEKLTSIPITTPNKLIEIEKASTGNVKFGVYMYYLKSVGWGFVSATLLFQILYQVFTMSANIWLSKWSDDNETSTDTGKRDLYLGVYGGLGLGQAASVLLSTIIMAFGTMTAGMHLHTKMLGNVLKSPLPLFFDITPIGRVVNRFSSDINTVDSTIPMNLRSFIGCLFGVIGTFLVICYSTPLFTAIIVPTFVIYFFVQRFYVATSRQLKRIESISRSPIYSHFGETLAGCQTIRAYGQEKRFIQENEDKVDFNQTAYYPSIIANRWLAIRLEAIGNFLIFFAALFVILSKDSIHPGIAGLSISYALSITQTLNWLVRMTSDVEANIVAVERIKEYCETKQEAAWINKDWKPDSSWPQKGAVEFDHYQTRYREGLDLVLKNVTCKIEPGEKIGIVGRTGAGKSSLTLALFRIIEATDGKILIDGLDISKMGLHDVRERLTIIPQDPVLFSGSLRLNLDPFENFTDEELWRVLELSHLKHFVKGLAAGLSYELSEGGDNLSVGQRQLICLARALLKRTKILVLDEATAAVDLETDVLIQKTIRSEFKDCTVLTIAHRLNTIMDSSRILVFDKGEIKEFETPTNLLNNKKSAFYDMAKDAGLV